jgi:CcdB protein
VARFDVFANPNPRARYAHWVDVQSDLVTTATRWCIPLLPAMPGQKAIAQAQAFVTANGARLLLDTPNMLTVPAALLKQAVARLDSPAQTEVEACIDFMLRGY